MTGRVGLISSWLVETEEVARSSLLLVGEGKTVGVDKVPTQTMFKMAEHGSSVQDAAIKKLGKINVLPNEDILLSIDTKTAPGKVAFNLVNT